MNGDRPPSDCEAGHGRTNKPCRELPDGPSARGVDVLAPRRWKAPADDRGVLIDPPLDEAAAAICVNLAAREARNFSIGDVSFAEFSSQARADMLLAARDHTRAYRDVPPMPTDVQEPIVLAGHQPELFHPGVWAKNFALAALTQRARATAINLVIDGDTLNSATLRVPAGTADDTGVEAVPFDAPAEPIPYEERSIIDWSLFRSFGDRAVELLRPLVPEPMLRDVWPRIVAAAEQTCRPGAAFAQARHQVEGEWGLTTLELPQSRLCRTRAFCVFVADLLSRLDEFVDVHNASLAEFRRAARVRSANHPVPELVRTDGWVEAPFWLWTAEDPRRKRMFVRRLGSELEITDRAEIVRRVPLAGEGSVAGLADALFEFASQGIRLRTRALTTTLYARLMVGDYFLHGIGGGKYDGLTNLLIERFYGTVAPAFGVVSATRRLPIAREAMHLPSQSEIRRSLWQVRHHPETVVEIAAWQADRKATAAALLEKKRRLIRERPASENRREWCREIRRTNVELQEFAGPAIENLQKNLAAAERREPLERLLESREFACYLFPEKDLRAFLLDIFHRQR